MTHSLWYNVYKRRNEVGELNVTLKKGHIFIRRCSNEIL